MDKTLFDELRQSLKEAKAIAKSEARASHRFAIPPLGAKAVGEPSTSTNWKALCGMSDVEIHAGIAYDPDVRATDADFWKKAKLAIPKTK